MIEEELMLRKRTLAGESVAEMWTGRSRQELE